MPNTALGLLEYEVRAPSKRLSAEAKLTYLECFCAAVQRVDKFQLPATRLGKKRKPPMRPVMTLQFSFAVATGLQRDLLSLGSIKMEDPIRK